MFIFWGAQVSETTAGNGGHAQTTLTFGATKCPRCKGPPRPLVITAEEKPQKKNYIGTLKSLSAASGDVKSKRRVPVSVVGSKFSGI